jgi:prevent-host-death family protein
MTVNMHEAKTNLSKLIMLLEKGEDIIIAKAGNPVARLTAYEQSPQRVPNQLKGRVRFKEDFDSSNDEIRMLFEGGF